MVGFAAPSHTGSGSAARVTLLLTRASNRPMVAATIQYRFLPPDATRKNYVGGATQKLAGGHVEIEVLGDLNVGSRCVFEWVLG